MAYEMPLGGRIHRISQMRGLACLFGAPGSRKSFTTIDLSLHIATGRRWRGREVEQRAVVYASLEGGESFRNRIAAWRAHHAVDSAAFFRSPAPLDLHSTEADVERLILAARDIGEPVGLVVVDTLVRAMAGGDENAGQDMGRLIADCHAIARDLACLVLLVHHSGKDAAGGSRGHSSLLGALDTELALADGVMTITKQRDAPAGLAFGVDLETVVIGQSDRGKAITSAVAIEGSDAQASPRLGPAQARALEALRQFLDDHGEPCPGGTGWPERGARKTVKIEPFAEFLAAKVPSGRPTDRRKSAYKAINDLVDKGIVQVNQGHAWII